MITVYNLFKDVYNVHAGDEMDLRIEVSSKFFSFFKNSEVTATKSDIVLRFLIITSQSVLPIF